MWNLTVAKTAREGIDRDAELDKLQQAMNRLEERARLSGAVAALHDYEESQRVQKHGSRHTCSRCSGSWREHTEPKEGEICPSCQTYLAWISFKPDMESIRQRTAKRMAHYADREARSALREQSNSSH